jgi:hypothetical protein
MGAYAQRANKRAERMLEEMESPVNKRSVKSPLVQLVEEVLLPGGNLTSHPRIPITDQEWWDGWETIPDLNQVVNKLVEAEKLKVPLNQEDLLYWASGLMAQVISL